MKFLSPLSISARPFSLPRIVSMLFALFAGAAAIQGAVLLNEPFDYPNGPLVTVSGGLWVTHSGTAGQVEVLSGRADLSAPESEDVNALLAGQPYPANTNTVVYCGFTVNFSALPSASGEYFAHFKDATTSNFRAKIFALTSGASAGQFRIGIANASNGPAAVFPASLNLNTDYRVYVRYGISNFTSELWVDPGSEASPSVTATDATTARAVVAFALRQNIGIGIIQMNDLRVATSFAEVYQAPALVPPGISQSPASTGAIEGGTATFNVTATGSDPLTYQWTFNSTNLPGATNTSLMLTNLALAQAGPYSVIVSNAVGSTNSAPATLTVFSASTNGTLTFVTYNMKGNFAADWSTNAPQVQAIARELRYLNADIMTLNEIPNGLRYEMTNWMVAFFPGYNLAISSGTDGAIRSGVMSRYSITRSNSWLDGASLTNFGYDGTFTRDLFEAQIAVPGYPQPLHVFTTHLKSGTSSSDDAARRAAEASAVSNFFVTVYFASNSLHPYTLSGDMNEDIAIPATGSQQPIQRLTNGTGLVLTSPLNPYTQTNYTHSIQTSNGPSRRYDYILPCGLLSTNIVSSQVFRTDLLNPVPLNLNSNDDMVASDHLPVQMVFVNPYDRSFRFLALTRTNLGVTLKWESVYGQPYRVEITSNLTAWSLLATDLVATNSTYTFTTNLADEQSFFRVSRVP